MRAPKPTLESALLEQAARHAQQYLGSVADRHVGATAFGDELRAWLGTPLSENGEDAGHVIAQLAQAGERGTLASQGPRYFGFVIGGSLPVTTAADWLVSAWDQNAQMYIMSPIGAVVEEIASDWLKDVFRLPSTWSVGFVTGAQMANFTALVTARHHVLSKVNRSE